MAQIRREGRLSPPLEGTWPGEWDPARQDAEMAHNPLKTSFVDSFKKALLADQSTPNAIQYFEAGAQSSLNTISESEQGIAYPLMLFSRLPPVPVEDEVNHLTSEFFTHFHARTAILRSVPPNVFDHPVSAQYLRYAVACLGSTLSYGPPSVAENLFWASTLLITGILEIDNRIARTMDLVAAWVLLEVYGVLSADPMIWRRTNIIHGFVETASRRLFGDFKETDSQERSVEESPNNLILSYFMMMDVFRAIHFGGPTSLSTQEFSIRLSPSSYELNSVFQMAAFNLGPLPSELSSDNALLLLTTILGEINTVVTLFHPFEDLATENSTSQKPARYRNPHLPLSLSNETSQAKRKLDQSLDSWKEAYSKIIDPNILVLFYFCKLQLVFPNLQYLPVLAGYPPRVARNSIPVSIIWKRIRQDFGSGTNALKHAWLIIESCNSGRGETSVWLPIAIFYASLVVWSMIFLEGETRSCGSLKVLAVFKMELEGMKWPCCRVMADVLDSLMKGEHSMPLGE